MDLSNRHVPPPQSYSKYSWHNSYGHSKINNYYDNHNCTKYKYHSADGKIAAGGILFYDKIEGEKGIWVIEELDDINGSIIYTDFGGKYDYNDGDIIATIAREFREETYNTEEISFKNLKTVSEKNYVYISGYDRKPTYLCIVIDINMFNIKFDSEKIKKERIKISLCNPKIPEFWYKTRDVKFIKLKDINDKKIKLSQRLEAILKVLKSPEREFPSELSNHFKN
jgi:hypothetical protein